MFAHHRPRPGTSSTIARATAVLLGTVLAVTALAAPAAAATSTLTVTEGYDAKQGKLMSADGTLGRLNSSNNDRFGVESGYWISTQYQNTVPASATVQSVTLHVEHYEESDITSGQISWQAGFGTLSSPAAPAATHTPPLRVNEGAEGVDTWNLTSVADTPAEINNLRVVVRNANTAGKKGFVDRMSLVVVYDEIPVAPTITSTPGTTAIVGTQYSHQATASGTTPVTWSLTTAPAGMTVNPSSGLITWTPTADGSNPVTLQATNSVGFNERTWQITARTTPTITSSPGTSAVVGSAYSYQATAGGTAPITWSLTTAPAGMTVNASSGLVSWTPGAAGSFPVTLRAANAAGAVTQSWTTTVTTAPPVPTAPTITSTAGTAATVNSPYGYQAAASGTTPITWSLPTAPAGMTVNGSGLVSWTPTAAGSSAVTLQAANSVGTTTQSWTVTVTVAPASAMLLAAGDVSDCGNNGDSQTAAVVAQHPQATVAGLGDLAYESGTAAEFANCYNPTWGAHKARTRPVPGNHEYQSSGAGPYYDYFGAAAGTRGQGYYSYDLGPWHVVALNSEISVTATSAQATWLRNDLAANTERCTLAYWHKPRFTAGNYGDFTAYTALWQILYDANAEVVLSGHDHIYERYQPMTASGASDPARGLRQFVVGTGGRGHYALRADARRQAGSTGTLGVLQLTLNADSYGWKFLPVAGSTYTDSGTTSCH